MWGNVYAGTGLFMRVTQPVVSLNKGLAVMQMIQRLGERNASAVEILASSLQLGRQVRACRARHRGTAVGVCLAAMLLALHPCPKAGGAAEIMGLAKKWLSWARQSEPQAVVDGFEQLSTGKPVAGRRGRSAIADFPSSLLPAGRFALHWLFGICGIGPSMLRHSGWGWDALLGSLACALGHKTVVLAASANDNGLLHQEFVDFDIPEPFGWPGISSDSTRTNPMHRCLKPFAWVRADRESGRRAEARRHAELRRILDNSHKFMLAPQTPCVLRFGPDGRFASEEARFEACRVPGPGYTSSMPSNAKACWAWCEGSMSQAYSATSLLQVRSIRLRPMGRRLVHGSGPAGGDGTGWATAVAEAKGISALVSRSQSRKKRTP